MLSGNHVLHTRDEGGDIRSSPLYSRAQCAMFVRRVCGSSITHNNARTVPFFKMTNCWLVSTNVSFLPRLVAEGSPQSRWPNAKQFARQAARQTVAATVLASIVQQWSAEQVSASRLVGGTQKLESEHDEQQSQTEQQHVEHQIDVSAWWWCQWRRRRRYSAQFDEAEPGTANAIAGRSEQLPSPVGHLQAGAAEPGSVGGSIAEQSVAVQTAVQRSGGKDPWCAAGYAQELGKRHI